MEYEGAIYHEMDRGNRRWADRKHRISGFSGKMAFRQVLPSKSSHHLTRNSERILPWAGDYPEWNAKDRRSGARIVPKNFRPDRLACALKGNANLLWIVLILPKPAHTWSYCSFFTTAKPLIIRNVEARGVEPLHDSFASLA